MKKKNIVFVFVERSMRSVAWVPPPPPTNFTIERREREAVLTIRSRIYLLQHTHIHRAVSQTGFFACVENYFLQNRRHMLSISRKLREHALLLLLIARSPNLRNVNVERYYRKLLLCRASW